MDATEDDDGAGLGEPDFGAAPPCGCPACGAPLRWSQTEAGGDGCWLAICTCGRPAARLPRRPDHEPDDPIQAAFGPPQVLARPPWIRVFQVTSGHPWWLPWRHVPSACPSCRQRVTFSVWTTMPGRRTAYSELCLACGRATSEYLWPRGGMREVPVTGSEWSPPCVAVARLRRAGLLATRLALGRLIHPVKRLTTPWLHIAAVRPAKNRIRRPGCDRRWRLPQRVGLQPTYLLADIASVTALTASRGT